VAVKPEIALASRYAQPSYARFWWTLLGVAVVAIVGVGLWLAIGNRQPPSAPRFTVPQEVTPFAVLGLLRDIQTNNGLHATDQQDLAASIDRLERHYFAAPEPAEPDLHDIANRWVAKAR
jgi:hypothetical protein